MPDNTRFIVVLKTDPDLTILGALTDAARNDDFQLFPTREFAVEVLADWRNELKLGSTIDEVRQPAAAIVEVEIPNEFKD